MEKTVKIPAGVTAVMERLAATGQQAYLVGGCVRDRYMEIPPHDFDITTSALPEEMLKIFKEDRVIQTGLQHGTVTVLTADGPVEVTTFRQDGVYTDHRHPDQVTFTRSLQEDLARRDFTMNAMAMDAAGNIIDPFGGREDIDAGLIRCVGNAERRFEEDALRILRGLRFSARLGFQIERETAIAMEHKKDLLQEIAAERVFAELCGLLAGAHCVRVLEQYGTVPAAILPELDLNGLKRVEMLPPEPAMRLAALLPAEQAVAVLKRLKVSNTFRQEVLQLVTAELPSPERRAVWQGCVKMGAENLMKLATYYGRAEEFSPIVQQLLQEGACMGIGDLAVNGRDMEALGYRGKEIGTALKRLLIKIVEEDLPNERETLIKFIKNNNARA